MEPLVQGAAGMLLQPPGYLRAVRDLCDRHDVFLVCDEVATGFGRTGTCSPASRRPWCRTSCVWPRASRAATCRSPRRSRPSASTTGSWASYDEFRTFFHGHTYTGNPLACAAALATLDVFEEERTLERLAPKTALLEQLLRDLVEPLPHVAEVRQIGFMCGIELADRDGRPHDPALRMGTA